MSELKVLTESGLTYVFEEIDEKLVAKADIAYVEGEVARINETLANLDVPEGVMVDSALDAESTNPVQNMVITKVLDTKVDAVAGKGLSTNDYTTAEKMKLQEIDLSGYCTSEDMMDAVTSLRIVKTEYVYTNPSTMFVTFEVPAYKTDGSTTLEVFVNGLICLPNVDYTVTNNMVTMTKSLGPNQTCYFIVRGLSVRGESQ